MTAGCDVTGKDGGTMKGGGGVDGGIMSGGGGGGFGFVGPEPQSSCSRFLFLPALSACSFPNSFGYPIGFGILASLSPCGTRTAGRAVALSTAVMCCRVVGVTGGVDVGV